MARENLNIEEEARRIHAQFAGKDMDAVGAFFDELIGKVRGLRQEQRPHPFASVDSEDGKPLPPPPGPDELLQDAPPDIPAELGLGGAGERDTGGLEVPGRLEPDGAEAAGQPVFDLPEAPFDLEEPPVPPVREPSGSEGAGPASLEASPSEPLQPPPQTPANEQGPPELPAVELSAADAALESPETPPTGPVEDRQGGSAAVSPRAEREIPDPDAAPSPEPPRPEPRAPRADAPEQVPDLPPDAAPADMAGEIPRGSIDLPSQLAVPDTFDPDSVEVMRDLNEDQSQWMEKAAEIMEWQRQMQKVHNARLYRLHALTHQDRSHYG